MQSKAQSERYSRISSADLPWNLAPVPAEMVNIMDRLSFILSEPMLEPKVVEQELSSKKGGDSHKMKQDDTTRTSTSREGSKVASRATDSVDDEDNDTHTDTSKSDDGEYDSDDSDWKTMSQARRHFARKRAEEAKIPETPLGLTDVVTAFRQSNPGSTWNKNHDRRERFSQRIIEDLGRQYENRPSHVVKLGDGTEMGLEDVVGSRIPDLVDLPDTLVHWTSFCTYAYSLFADAEDQKERDKKGSTSYSSYRHKPSRAYDDQATSRWTMFWNLLGQTTPSGTEGRPKFVYHGTDQVMSSEEEVFTTLLKMAMRGPDEVHYPDGKVKIIKREEAPTSTRLSQPSGKTWHEAFTQWKSKAVEEERMRSVVPQLTTDWSLPASEKSRGSSWWRSRS